MPEQRPIVVLRLVCCIEGSNTPVGPRFERHDPLPYLAHYAKEGGYYFDYVKELDAAKNCRVELQKYIDKHHYEPLLKKQGKTPKEDARKKSEQAQLVDTAAGEAQGGVRAGRDNEVRDGKGALSGCVVPGIRPLKKAPLHRKPKGP